MPSDEVTPLMFRRLSSIVKWPVAEIEALAQLAYRPQSFWWFVQQFESAVRLLENHRYV